MSWGKEANVVTEKVTSRNKSDFDYSAHFGKMRVLHDLTTMPEDTNWRAGPQRSLEPHQVVLYLGCNVLMTSHMIQTVTDIFDMLGVDYVAVGGPAYCCGIVHHQKGDIDIAESMGRNAVRYFERFQPERVVMWCPSCISYYDEMFQVPSSYKTQHVTEFLVDYLDQMKFIQEVPQKVALHYHSNRPQRLVEAQAAETLFSAVPGLEYVKIDSDVELQRSCSPITQEVLGMDRWQEIIEQQMRDAGEAGADTFATLYHGCQRFICLYEEKFPLTIEHYLSVFARSLGIEHEDTYKKYSLWRDPDRVLADMAPCMKASGVTTERASELVQQTFPAD